jgi:hypothetical protein
VTNATYVGVEGFSEVANSGGSIGSTNVATYYVTPSVNTTYELRQTTVNTISVSSSYASYEITQVNPPVAMQATATGTMNTNFIKYTRTASQSVSVNSVVICNVLENGSGNAISANTSTGQVTLTSGKIYRLRGTIGSIAGSAAGAQIGYGWYNETTSAWIGEGAGFRGVDSAAWNATAGGTAEAIISANTTTIVSFRIGSTINNISSIGGTSADFGVPYAYPFIDIEEIGSTFSLTAISGLTTTGDVNVGGNLNVTGTGSNVITKVTGSWTLSTGTNTVSFTVPAGESYVMWVNGNIPNGIINWNATVTLSNANVPVIGVQYGWYYLAGNALALTSIPNQIVGTAGTISTSAPAVSNSNTFTFGITNNSGTPQIVYYGYTKVS